MNIDFYFDPSCPWCWVTSRWLTEVSTKRDIQINWLPFSLATKNGELDGEDTTGHMEPHVRAHKVLRIIEAAHAKSGVDRGELYTAFGRAYYLDRGVSDEEIAEKVLDDLGMDTELAKEAQNTVFDAKLQEFMDGAMAIVGSDVGVPLIIFKNEAGEKQGFFGPVLQGLPDEQEGLDLWDGISKLATSSRFFELKRGRTGGAQPQSTARLFEN